MQRQSARVAVGGVFSALCLVIMMLTAFPLGTYALPALAGAMLIPVVIEMGGKTAAMVYGSVSLLCVFIAPDPEASLLFVAFFGYYPILKERLEQMKSRRLEWLCKLILFNAAMILGYGAGFLLFFPPAVLESFGDFTRAGLALMLALGNVYFVLYDIAMTRYIAVYLHQFRKRFLRR